MRWKAKYLLVAESMYEFGAGMFGPIYAVFVQDIGGDLLTAGWAWSVFAIVCGITLYVMGKLEDRIKRDETIVFIGFVLASLGFFGYLFVSKPWHLFVVQSVLGFGWAFGTPALDAIYSKNVERGKADSQWGAFEASIRIVEGISAFVGAAIAYAFGFKVLFGVMCAVSVVAVIVVSKFIWKKKK